MTSIKSTARLAGIMYLTMSVMAVLSFVGVFGDFVVAGDPAGTMKRIADRELVYRLAIVNDLVTNILLLAVAATLYHLFVDVDRRLSMLMLVFVAVPIGMQMASLVDRLAPLTLLRNPEAFAPVSDAGRNLAAQWFLGLHRNMGQLVTPFWGLWLFPFGTLVIKSRYFPRVLGVLMMAAGLGYLVTGFTSLLFPDQLSTVSKVMMPLYFGELPIVFWLAVFGARGPRNSARTESMAAWVPGPGLESVFAHLPRGPD